MADAREKNPPTDDPLLHEENGELSLHFGFPTIQSRMLRADPERLLLDYTRTMMGFLLFAPEPARIAMIGLGGGSLAKYCHRRLPGADFTAVELSPAVIALRTEFAIPDDDARFRVVCADGAEFIRAVRDAGQSFDVLLIDGFDSGGQPHRLCSADFYDDCRASLTPGGILVVNPVRRRQRLRPLYRAESAVRSLKKPSLSKPTKGDNKIVFACRDREFPPTLRDLTERLVALRSETPG